MHLSSHLLFFNAVNSFNGVGKAVIVANHISQDLSLLVSILDGGGNVSIYRRDAGGRMRTRGWRLGGLTPQRGRAESRRGGNGNSLYPVVPLENERIFKM